LEELHTTAAASKWQSAHPTEQLETSEGWMTFKAQALAEFNDTVRRPREQAAAIQLIAEREAAAEAEDLEDAENQTEAVGQNLNGRDGAGAGAGAGATTSGGTPTDDVAVVVESGTTAAPTPTPTPAPAPAPTPIPAPSLWTAEYDYNAGAPDEVSFKDGDVFDDVSIAQEGWLHAKVLRTGASGNIPANYVVHTGEAVALPLFTQLLSETKVELSEAQAERMALVQAQAEVRCSSLLVLAPPHDRMAEILILCLIPRTFCSKMLLIGSNT
jgi:hypothetical protein